MASIWKKAYTMSVVSVHSHSYDINIYIQSSSTPIVQTLTPSKIAFDFQESNDDDLLSTFRGSTGYIRFLYTGTNYDIFPQNMTDRYVEVLRDNEIIWQGFLIPDSYSQELNEAPYEVEIPCQSILDALEAINMVVPNSGTTATTFGNMLIEAFDQIMGEERNVFDSVIYPQYTPSTEYADNDWLLNCTLYKLGFCDYLPDNSNANNFGMVGWNWKKIFIEYLRLYGFSIRIYKNTLYIITPGTELKYQRNTWSGLRNGTNGTEETIRTNLHLSHNILYESINNSYENRRGYQKLVVTANNNKIEYGVKIDNSFFYGDGTVQVLDANTHYVAFGSCNSQQPNLVLDGTYATPLYYDIWAKSENDSHLSYQFNKCIGVSGISGAEPSDLRTSNCTEAFRLIGCSPLVFRSSNSSIIISGTAKRGFLNESSANQRFIYASLKCGNYYWGGGTWINAAVYEPVFKIPVDTNGEITKNPNLTSEYYREHGNKSGYMITFPPSGVDNPPILTIYRPYNYGDASQLLGPITLDFTNAQRPFELQPPIDIDEILNNNNVDEYKIDDLNVTDFSNPVGWFAPLAYWVRIPYYARMFYSNTIYYRTIGDAYLFKETVQSIDYPFTPHWIYEENGEYFKILSLAMNSYDDTGEVKVYKVNLTS